MDIKEEEWNIDEDRLDLVFKLFKKKIDPKVICHAYRHYEDIYKHDLLRQASLEDLAGFSDVFYFQRETFEGCKRQFIDFISKHKEFYNDDPEVMHDRMMETLNEINENRENDGLAPVPFINLLPAYGGKVANKKALKQCMMNFYRDNPDLLVFEPTSHGDDKDDKFTMI